MSGNMIAGFACEIDIGVDHLQRAGEGRRTIIIDRCPLFREGLRQVFRDTLFEVIAADSDLQNIRDDNETACGSLLIIIATSDDPGADLRVLKQAQARFPGSLLVSLCQDCDPKRAAQLMRAGASAILSVPENTEDIVVALELVTLGQRVVPLHLISSCLTGSEPDAVEEFDPTTPVRVFSDADNKAFRLSLREIEILRCLLAGESNRSVARRLMIAEATVKVHIKAILRKIKVKNRTQAAIWAVGNMGAFPTWTIADPVVGPPAPSAHHGPQVL